MSDYRCHDLCKSKLYVWLYMSWSNKKAVCLTIDVMIYKQDIFVTFDVSWHTKQDSYLTDVVAEWIKPSNAYLGNQGFESQIQVIEVHQHLSDCIKTDSENAPQWNRHSGTITVDASVNQYQQPLFYISDYRYKYVRTYETKTMPDHKAFRHVCIETLFVLGRNLVPSRPAIGWRNSANQPIVLQGTRFCLLCRNTLYYTGIKIYIKISSAGKGLFLHPLMGAAEGWEICFDAWEVIRHIDLQFDLYLFLQTVPVIG